MERYLKQKFSGQPPTGLSLWGIWSSITREDMNKLKRLWLIETRMENKYMHDPYTTIGHLRKHIIDSKAKQGSNRFQKTPTQPTKPMATLQNQSGQWQHMV
ncbi:hypothetical protein JHK82_055533 [Glycine max]|nr:hypothetical protein JHK82_055533 [Glycine max]